jgi:hypothetical protein
MFPVKGTRNRGRGSCGFVCCVLFEWHHLAHVHDIEAYNLKAVGKIFPWHVWGNVMHRLFGNRRESKR